MPRPTPAGPLAIVLALMPAVTLAACGSEAAREAGGVSPGEAEALEEAAEMLDARRLPPEALPTEADPDAASSPAAAAPPASLPKGRLPS